MTAAFQGGHNIAMKVPPHQYEQTVNFYANVLKLEQVSGADPEQISFKFGSNRLWIDKVPTLSQAELWLEIVTGDIEQAKATLAAVGVTRCDEIEPLPEGFKGFWISNPGGIIHLVANSGEEGP